jgi:hypothetical protein
MADPDRTASLMTPAKLAQAKPKAPVSAAAWLDQMAADAGHMHVRRLGELCRELQGQDRLGDISPAAAALAALAEALPRLDFGLLQSRGWWARTTGKSRSAGAEFATQFEKIEEVSRGLAAHVQALDTRQQAQVTVSELTLVEIEVEVRALEKILDQGARWLQDMRNQLKAREAAAAADPQSRQAIQDDALRCEILVARLKLLRAVSSAAQHAHQQAQAAAVRRAAVLRLLQQAVATNVKSWQARLSALAGVAGDDDAPALSLEGPMESHRELQLCVKQAIADCGQLQAQEKALAGSLGELDVQAQAAKS